MGAPTGRSPARPRTPPIGVRRRARRAPLGLSSGRLGVAAPAAPAGSRTDVGFKVGFRVSGDVRISWNTRCAGKKDWIVHHSTTQVAASRNARRRAPPRPRRRRSPCAPAGRRSSRVAAEPLDERAPPAPPPARARRAPASTASRVDAAAARRSNRIAVVALAARRERSAGAPRSGRRRRSRPARAGRAPRPARPRRRRPSRAARRARERDGRGGAATRAATSIGSAACHRSAAPRRPPCSSLCAISSPVADLRQEPGRDHLPSGRLRLDRMQDRLDDVRVLLEERRSRSGGPGRAARRRSEKYEPDFWTTFRSRPVSSTVPSQEMPSP